MMKKQKEGFWKKGREEFKFNVDVELRKFKSVTGERLQKEDLKYIEDYNQKSEETNGEKIELVTDYNLWKKNIEEKYKSFSREQLLAFRFYLQHGSKMQKRFKDEVVVLAIPIIIGVVQYYLENILKMADDAIGAIGLIVAFVGFLVLFAIYFIEGLKLLEKPFVKKDLYDEYIKIVEDLLLEK